MIMSSISPLQECQGDGAPCLATGRDIHEVGITASQRESFSSRLGISPLEKPVLDSDITRGGSIVQFQPTYDVSLCIESL